MRHALLQAQQAWRQGEVPIGAVLISSTGEPLAAAHNAPICRCDPTAHAEIETLRLAAQKVGNYRLPGTTLYATLEPCVMCFGALVHARIARLVFGASDPRQGACGGAIALHRAGFFNHRVEVVGGVLVEPCRQILRQFFYERR